MARKPRTQPSPEPAEVWLTVPEAAAMLRKHPQTVRKYIREGLLRSSHGPSLSPNGRRHEIRQSDLQKFRARFMSPARIEAPRIEDPSRELPEPEPETSMPGEIPPVF